MKGADTIVFEQIRLVLNEQGGAYIPTVKGQNDGQAVNFPLKSITTRQIVCENKTHDFPQLISYTLISADSLMAEVSGIQNGRARSEKFPMQKVAP